MQTLNLTDMQRLIDEQTLVKPWNEKIVGLKSFS